MTTTTTKDTTLPVAIEEFVRRIETAEWEGMEDHLTPDAVRVGEPFRDRAQVHLGLPPDLGFVPL